MVSSLLAIFKRNLKIILNTKLSFLMIFLGPLILMLLVGGILQSTQLRGLDIKVYTNAIEVFKHDDMGHLSYSFFYEPDGEEMIVYQFYDFEGNIRRHEVRDSEENIIGYETYDSEGNIIEDVGTISYEPIRGISNTGRDSYFSKTDVIISEDHSYDSEGDIIEHKWIISPQKERDNFVSSIINNLIYSGHNIFIEERDLESCKLDVLEGNVHACLEIQKELDYSPLPEKTIDSPSYNIVSHVDYSQTRSVWMIIETIRRAVETETYNIAYEKVQSLFWEIERLIFHLKISRGRVYSLIENLEDYQTYYTNLEEEKDIITHRIEELNESLDSLEYELNQIQINHPEIAMILYIPLTNIFSQIYQMESNLGFMNQDYYLMQEEKMGQLTELKENSLIILDYLDDLILSWETLEQTSISDLSNPIQYKAQSIGEGITTQASQLEFIDYLFPTFLMFFIIFLCLVFPASITIRERKTKAYIRNMTSKTSGFKFLLSNFGSCLIIIFVQILVLLLISKFFLNAEVLGSIIPLIIICSIAISILTLFGMCMGHLFNGFDSAIIGSLSLSLLLLVLLPGITPPEMLHPFISRIMSYSPIGIIENKIKSALIFEMPLKFSMIESISLISATFLGIILLGFFYINSRKKEI